MIDAYSGFQGQDNPKDIKKNSVIPWAGLRRRGLRSAWSMAMDASPNVWVVRGPCPVESIAAYERTLKKDNGPTDVLSPFPYSKKSGLQAEVRAAFSPSLAPSDVGTQDALSLVP